MDPPPPPVDLLSSLPEPLQDEILRRLDLRNAVRTSVLSRAWRRRWETVPRLVLSFPAGTPVMVVYSVLLRYAPSVSSFVTNVDGDDGKASSHVNNWICGLFRRSVESIVVNNRRGKPLTIHSSIFPCNCTLVSLTLQRCRIPPLPPLQPCRRLVSLSLERCSVPLLPPHQPQPGFDSFPVLKKLCITFVCFTDNGRSLQAMIRASPMLRVLFLEQVTVADMDFVIEAPNLHTVGIISNSCDLRFGNLPCLQCASISLTDLFCEEWIIKFLAVVSHVEELIFNIQFCEQKWMDNATSFTFSNLKRMELLTDFCDMDNILLIICLLRSSPKLEKLKIEFQKPEMVVNWKDLNAQWSDGMCANLQVVEITSAKGCLPLSFIKLVLSKASRLCTLSVDAWLCTLSVAEKDIIELLTCTRASPRAELRFKNQLDGIRFDRIKFA